MKAGSSGTTKTRKIITLPAVPYQTVLTARTLLYTSAVGQMGQQKHLSNFPCANRSSFSNTQTVVRQCWACVLRRSGYSGTVKTVKTKIHSMEKFHSLS